MKDSSRLKHKKKQIKHSDINLQVESISRADAKVIRRKLLRKKTYWFLGIIGSIASVISFILALRPIPSVKEINQGIEEKLDGKLKEMREELQAKSIKVWREFPALNETTISGMSTYDDSYISAVLDGIRNIHEFIFGTNIYSQDQKMVVGTNVHNLGDCLRLSYKTSVKGFIVQEDMMQLDVFPNTQKNPTHSFTIIVKNFMVKSISKDFSIKQLDYALEKSGFEIKMMDSVKLENGALKIKCTYKKSNIQGIKVIVGEGIGIPSNKRLYKDHL